MDALRKAVDDQEKADAIARIKLEVEKLLGPEIAEAYSRELTFAVVEAEWKRQAENELEVA